MYRTDNRYNGVRVDSLEHIKDRSYYNHNYYKGFNNDILYAESDDDNTTNWFLIEGDNKCSIIIGDSFMSDYPNETIEIY